MFSRAARIVLPLLFFCAPFFADDARAGGHPPIVIGQVIDLSGASGGALGRDYVAGIKTFFDQQNAAGGLHGRKIEYVVVDDRGEPAAAAAAVKSLIGQHNPDYLLGGVGDASLQAVLTAQEFRASGLLMFAPLAGMLESDRVLRWRPNPVSELTFLLRHFQRSGVKSASVVLQEGEMKALAARLPALMKDAGIQLIKVAALGSEQANAATAGEIAAAAPGLVLVLADTVGTGLFLAQYRKVQPGGFVAGTSRVDLATLKEIASASLEWTVLSQVVPDVNGLNSKLQLEHRDMMRRFRDEPASALTLEGYAAARTLAALIERNALPKVRGVQSLQLHAPMDVGGMTVKLDARTGALSSYLDVALLRGGARLKF